MAKITKDHIQKIAEVADLPLTSEEATDLTTVMQGFIDTWRKMWPTDFDDSTPPEVFFPDWSTPAND